MTVSPLATLRESLRTCVGESYNLITQGESRLARRQPSAQRIYDTAKEALAVLDSLDGTITLSRSEAATIQRHIVQDGFSGATKEEVLALLEASRHDA